MTLAVFLVLAGLGLCVFSIRQAVEMRAFAARAKRVRLRVIDVDEERMRDRQGAVRVFYKPHFEVADGPHAGLQAKGARLEAPLHRVGTVCDGWLHRVTGRVETDETRRKATSFEWVGGLLGFALLWGGLALLWNL